MGSILDTGLVSPADLERLFLQKYGAPATLGWGPRRRKRFDYYIPSDGYEALVSNLIVEGCAWIDVGGGHQIFPENPGLARTLVSRCSLVVAVDPSENVHHNQFVHQRWQGTLDDYRSDRQFEVATIRMVVEHVEDPAAFVASLGRLIRPGGTAVVFTVNERSPLTLLSRVTPFALHDPIKKLFWGGDEKDTFPVHYRMNSRSKLLGLFGRHGFRERAFAYLDDLSTFGAFRFAGAVEMGAWWMLAGLGLTYPENCLLGVYERQ